MKKFNRIVLGKFIIQFLDPFCQRQFTKNAASYVDYDQKQFQTKANEYYQKAELKQGYAPFCKHIFIENFANVQQSVVEITPDNEHLLKTVYEARTEKQLPVLRRYFPKQSVKVGPSKFLDLILYSKEQIQKENEAMGNVDPNKDIDYDFGIISVKPQDVPHETPMDPITMMRNALGKEEGGSGVKLEKEKYLESVAYWTKNAIVK